MNKNQHFWNFATSIVFIAATTACFLLIERNGGIRILFRFTALDLLLVSLATFRLVHLFTYDKVFTFVREFFKKEQVENPSKAERTASGVVHEMLVCLWCTGMWSALIAFTAYLLGPWGRFVVILLAVAGAGSLLQVISRAIADRR